jgi:hypothetical protein
MVTCHEVGDDSHNRDKEYDERRVVETPPDISKIVRSLMFKLDNWSQWLIEPITV